MLWFLSALLQRLGGLTHVSLLVPCEPAWDPCHSNAIGSGTGCWNELRPQSCHWVLGLLHPCLLLSLLLHIQIQVLLGRGC